MNDTGDTVTGTIVICLFIIVAWGPNVIDAWKGRRS